MINQNYRFLDKLLKRDFYYLRKVSEPFTMPSKKQINQLHQIIQFGKSKKATWSTIKSLPIELDEIAVTNMIISTVSKKLLYLVAFTVSIKSCNDKIGSISYEIINLL